MSPARVFIAKKKSMRIFFFFFSLSLSLFLLFFLLCFLTQLLGLFYKWSEKMKKREMEKAD